MKITNFNIGIIGTNCYLVQNEETKECFMVDLAACPTKLLNYIQDEGLKPVGVLLTHGHFDHIMGLHDFLEIYPVPVYAHEQEKVFLEDAKMNSSLTYGPGFTFEKAEYVKDKDKLRLAGVDMEVLYTPGHTIGGCCYYIASENTLFSGDTLFESTIGRTDLATGSSSQLIDSIQEKLLCLPDETLVYPGHMGATKIGSEKINNPFL